MGYYYENQPEMEDGEDFDKRMKRRQRNKEAAARCRQRRLELMQALQEQVDKHRQENLQKESQLRELRAQFERMQQFLHNHDCKLSQEERQAQMNMGLPPSSQYQLQNIPPHTQAPQTSLPSMNSSGGALQPSQAHLNTQSSEFRHILPDYNPQVSMGNDRKRHHQNIQPLPSAEEGFGPTVLKQPKPEPTLAALNNPMDVERPTNLFVSSSQGNASMPLTTPSNGIGTPYQPINTAFGGNFFTPGPGGDLLNGPTGLTPLTNNPVAVFPTSNSGSTPVETGERELRRL